MNEYLDISFKQILVFFDVLCETSIRDVDYLKQRYKTFSTDFPTTVDFINEFGLGTIDNGQYIVTTTLHTILSDYPKDNRKEEFVKNIFINYIMSGGTNISQIYQQYLNKFIEKEGLLIYNPTTEANLAQASTRNFLMELGIVCLAPDKSYYISPDFIYEVQNQSTNFSISDFKAINQLKEEVGRKAESWVINYERERLREYPSLQRKIEHVSEVNIGAGYDVLSYEGQQLTGFPAIYRYIEVKAVNLGFSRFYLSRNEIEVAKRNLQRYFLYLVHYQNSHEFSVRNLEIIQNPFENLILNSQDWNCEVESYMFRKNVLRNNVSN